MGQLVELVQAWEEYQLQHPDGALDGFGFWLRTRNNQASARQFRADDKEFDKYKNEAKLSMQAGYLIGKLNQYVMVYTKPIMKKRGLHSMDDFGYLATVQWHGAITKSRACQAMLHEITTGTDIIRRLVRLSFLIELPDTTDKRQKILQITAKGEKVLAQLQEDFRDIPDVLGDLDAQSRISLVASLMNLDVYHDNIIKEMRSYK
jgi:DNA-binding MarR family transcriptional regulator